MNVGRVLNVNLVVGIVTTLNETVGLEMVPVGPGVAVGPVVSSVVFVVSDVVGAVVFVVELDAVVGRCVVVWRWVPVVPDPAARVELVDRSSEPSSESESASGPAGSYSVVEPSSDVDDDSSGSSSDVGVGPTSLSADPMVESDGRSMIPAPTMSTAAVAASAASKVVLL